MGQYKNTLILQSYVSYGCVIQPNQHAAVHFIPVNFCKMEIQMQGQLCQTCIYLGCNDHELYRIVMDDPTRIVGQQDILI